MTETFIAAIRNAKVLDLDEYVIKHTDFVKVRKFVNGVPGLVFRPHTGTLEQFKRFVAKIGASEYRWLMIVIAAFALPRELFAASNDARKTAYESLLTAVTHTADAMMFDAAVEHVLGRNLFVVNKLMHRLGIDKWTIIGSAPLADFLQTDQKYDRLRYTTDTVHVLCTSALTGIARSRINLESRRNVRDWAEFVENGVTVMLSYNTAHSTPFIATRITYDGISMIVPPDALADVNAGKLTVARAANMDMCEKYRKRGFTVCFPLGTHLIDTVVSRENFVDYWSYYAGVPLRNCTFEGLDFRKHTASMLTLAGSTFVRCKFNDVDVTDMKLQECSGTVHGNALDATRCDALSYEHRAVVDTTPGPIAVRESTNVTITCLASAACIINTCTNVKITGKTPAELHIIGSTDVHALFTEKKTMRELVVKRSSGINVRTHEIDILNFDDAGGINVDLVILHPTILATLLGSDITEIRRLEQLRTDGTISATDRRQLEHMIASLKSSVGFRPIATTSTETCPICYDATCDRMFACLHEYCQACIKQLDKCSMCRYGPVPA